MYRLVLIVCAVSALALALPAPQDSESAHVRQAPQDPNISADEAKAELERFQNENAHYSFESKVDDDINDQALQRSETRDGTKVEGKYSYSDGFVRRTVHYIADENGYRIVKEDTEEIGNGPVFNPDGRADISGSEIGSYSIKLDNDDEEKHYKEVKAQ